jgi:two-component system, chemotaxis family, sensor kinase CheA
MPASRSNAPPPITTQRRPRAFLSVGVKLAFATVAVLVLVTALVVLELTTRERESILSSKSAAATAIADLLVEALVPPLDFHDKDEIQVELDTLRVNHDLLFAGVWMADDPSPVAALHGPDATASYPRPTSDAPALRLLGDRLELVRPVVRPDGKRLGTMMMALSLAKENAAFASTRRRIFWLSLLVVGGTATILLSIARRQIVAPLDRMMFAAMRIEKGDRDVRVEVVANDEFGRLGAVFNDMSAAIVEREKRLGDATRRLRELFDHMQQAIVVFGESGIVEKVASAQASIVFGQTSGRHVKDLLYPGASPAEVEVQALLDWLPLAFASTPDDWPEIASLAPRSVTLRNPRTAQMQWLSLELEPIRQDKRVVRMMLLATDQTALHRLEQTVRTQEQEHARQMERMRKLLAGGGQVFVSFLTAADERLARCLAIVAAVPPSPRGEDESKTIVELFHLVHTVRGEATAFGLGDVAVEACLVEDALDALQSRSRSGRVGRLVEVRRAIVEGLEKTRRKLAEAKAMFVSASPVGSDILDQITVRRSDIERLQQLVGERPDELGVVTMRLASRPFSDTVATLAEKVPNWAEGYGKRAALEIVGGGVLVGPRLGRVLPGVVTHLVRNAVAHGIEPIGERRDLGKADTGIVRIVCSQGSAGEGAGATDPCPVRVVVEDDGHGLDADALEARARDIGKAVADAAALAFTDGLSTAACGHELAGRGVGLSAVRSALASVGYRVDVDSRPGEGARFVIRVASS